jgi:hypothetical protein
MSPTPARGALAALAALAVTAVSACGDAQPAADRAPAATASAASATDGDWLLRFVTAEGADGEQSRAVYIRFNPTTGAASARTLPKVTATDANQDEQVLLVSADHARALLDTGVPKSEQRSGKLVLYRLADDATETVDFHALTGNPRLRPVATAFDPDDADVLRVVADDHSVWKVDLAAGTAAQEGTLPRRSGWIYGNGFDKLTGEPYIESIDSDRTEPAGNGDSDERPVERQGGTLIRYDGDVPADLPKPPCGFAGSFQFDEGTAWLFCADTPSITAYQTAKGGTTWHEFGTPSAKIVPAEAADLTFVLPPVS